MGKLPPDGFRPEEWELIFQAIGHPAMILDPNHEVIAANAATCEAIG